MAQKRDLNVNPYYDDFNIDNNFYKVLFKPGYPVQARELTTLQSILQNQVETFGSYTFKEGTMVIPGNVSYDNQFASVKLNASNFNIDISLYLDKLVGKTIVGSISGVSAYVQHIEPTFDDPTIYVRYLNSDNNFEDTSFRDGEGLQCTESIVYGNTTISANTQFASCIPLNATSIASAAFVGEGVYFVRGYFVKVYKQTLILDEYANTPSYRVGFRVTEEIVNAKDDVSLYDNAKGFSNFAAPGADRLKITLTLTKKELTDTEDTDFIEVLRLTDGQIKKLQTKTELNRLGDYIAERTYDESGHYSIRDFDVSLNESLNNGLGNNGLFREGQLTDQGSVPSDELMGVKLSPGIAYVYGQKIDKPGTTIIDVEKPRDTRKIENSAVPFEMGNLLRVNAVSGAPKIKSDVELHKVLNGTHGDSSTKIGDARVYTFNLTGDSYTGDSTKWDLYLYDIQTYTVLTTNRTIVSADNINLSSFIKGKNSGAYGHSVAAVTSGNTITVRQTSGSFSPGEQVFIDGIDTPLSVESIVVYSSRDIKSVTQSEAGFPNFSANSVLTKIPFNGVTEAILDGSNNLTIPGGIFTGIKEGDIVRYKVSGESDEVYNVVGPHPSASTIHLDPINTGVVGVYTGQVGSAGTYRVSLGVGEIKNNSSSGLYAKIEDDDISFVDLSSAQLSISAQITGSEANISGGTVTVQTTDVTGISSSIFETFDDERYSVHYNGGGIGTVTSDTFSHGSQEISIGNLNDGTDNVINVTLLKNSISSKIKQFNRSHVVNIDRSKFSKSGTTGNGNINDGLTYNSYYGLRVQDERICLNNPDVTKVLAVLESTDSNAPVLEELVFSGTLNIHASAIVGENIVGENGAIGRIVATGAANALKIIYLNGEVFQIGETVTFKESGIKTTIENITPPKFINLTTSFVFDAGQKEQYSDYSSILRTEGSSVPSRQLMIIYDYYTVPSNDNGDVFTILSYDSERFSEDIPEIGQSAIRASDTLDFRPRVSELTSFTKSPFDFSAREFGSDDTPKLILKPKESSAITYEHYLPRIDKVYLDRLGEFFVQKGVSSIDPKEPSNTQPDLMMEVATINLPAYLYDTRDAVIELKDNRRYTMRDIGRIEDRVENLEETTSLSLLELDTQTLQIRDSEGFDKFKSGVFVDDFKNNDLIDLSISNVDILDNSLLPVQASNSFNPVLASAVEIPENERDETENYALLDPNVQKTGNAVTLKYDSVDWIEQPLATKVQNVNEFHVVEYVGYVSIEPKADTWVRVIRLPGVSGTRTRTSGRGAVIRRVVRTRTVDQVVGTGAEQFMRQRNIYFDAANIKPLTRTYHFLDNNGNLDFIPKLLEICKTKEGDPGSVGTFQVGETVISYDDSGAERGRFRICTGNHKKGAFNNPTKTYNINPYIKTENLSSIYSESTKVLNVDVRSMAAHSQGSYWGYVKKNHKLVGQTSGAVAFIKDLRSISDNYGDLIGSVFIRNPHTPTPPPERISTGTKAFKLTTSPTNATPLPGSKLISSAETTYTATGTWQMRRTVTTTTIIWRRYDPIAQSFTVGQTIQAPSGTVNPNDVNDDTSGAFLTAVDLFFAHKPEGDEAVRVEIRTLELGTPTLSIVGEPVTLTPEEVNVSRTGETPTHVKFQYPIWLEPGQEYAVTLVAENTDQYEVWVAEMGEKTVNTKSLPNAEAVRYTKQFALGSLFLSQNGSIWTANQYEDMKFKLYKAKFTANSGTAFYYNPVLDEGNGYKPTLFENSLQPISHGGRLGITTIEASDGLISVLSEGRKIAATSGQEGFATIIGTGSSVTGSLTVTSAGNDYPANGTFSNVTTTALTGQGQGLTIDVTIHPNGRVNTVAANASGNGYRKGDIVQIASGISTGGGGRFTIDNCEGIDTLYLDLIQGQNDLFTPSTQLRYYDNTATIVGLANTTINSYVSGTGVNDGKHISVLQYDHGMYSGLDFVEIDGVEGNLPGEPITSAISKDATTGQFIGIAQTANFANFEGIPVDGTNLGYVKIGPEVISYSEVTNAGLKIQSRGVIGFEQPHDSNVLAHKYELNGVSLMRINKTHQVQSTENTIDDYTIQVDMGSSTNAIDRTSSSAGKPALRFNSSDFGGGSSIIASENIQFGEIEMDFGILNPSAATEVSGSIRTVSGRSVDGNEVAFVDQGFEPVELGTTTQLSSLRMVGSKVNEDAKLSGMPRNKSLTMALRLATKDQNLSPMIFTDLSSVSLTSSRLNSPVADYSTNADVKSVDFDPHRTIYVSNPINLTQQADSLKVILDAYRHDTADFRVLYSLIRADSDGVPQQYELFPGYDNLEIFDQAGFGVIDSSKNSGRPDTAVRSSLRDEFLEYEFTANDLDLFDGFIIKIVMSGTSQATPPRIKNLRAIATR
tara:strand:- start:6253 stop:13377 length:7125 start_codon:yes stop_codon:yes gene_type:complete